MSHTEKYKFGNRNKFKAVKLLILLVFVFFLFAIALKSSFFNIVTINVTGNIFLSKEEVVLLSQLKGKNIFLINKGKTEELIKNNPYVEDVIIDRRLPSSVNVNVIEKKIRGVIKVENSFINIDDKGKMVQILDKFPNNKLLMIEGTKSNQYYPGVNVFQDEKLQSCLIEVLKISQINNKLGVVKVNMNNPEDIILETKSGIKIHIGNYMNLDYKLGYAYSIMTNPSVRGQKGIIELHSDGVAVFKKN
ncbi:Cell division protein DivIB [Caloramator mitchellensis]|uniref:Cell division protein DivIB n=1 Tax=Caloramator mitchellensis TaxID=908809 RepID=A0A0R3JSZ1_CALMK|nr:FtsQ-type POTRA domain-containing protein [Caloramator mitchellensis]KRQ86584.1 Cell division protein DivIB [Caloramator mitchellensis]